MKMGLARFASVHPTRDSEATETNDLNKIELLNTTGTGSHDRCAILKLSWEASNPQQEIHVYPFSLMAFMRITNTLTVGS